MPQGALILASSLAGPCAFLEKACIGPSEIEDLLEAPRRAASDQHTVSLAVFVSFLQNAAAYYGDGLFGWMAGRQFDLNLLGDFGRTVLAAPNVREAIRLFCDAFDVIQSDSVMSLDVHGDEAVVSYRILNPSIWPRDQDAEFTLGIISALIERATGPSWRPISVVTEHMPHASEDSYGRQMRCALSHCASENAIRFPARVLCLRIAGSDSPMFRDDAAGLVQTARDRQRALSLSVRVRNEIARRIGNGPCGETAVARALGLSERSLRRHLGQEDVSYSDILDACRHDMARIFLALPAMTIDEIALRLSYSDRSAFERSFRRCVGATPSQFRLSLDSDG